MKLRNKSGKLSEFGEKQHQRPTAINSSICRSSLGGYVTVKTLASERLLRERNNLARFQTRTPHIRPFIDEIDPGKSSYALVLKHFDEELSEVIDHRRLAKRELKLVAKNVLEALRDLHADGWIHAGNLLILKIQAEGEN